MATTNTVVPKEPSAVELSEEAQLLLNLLNRLEQLEQRLEAMEIDNERLRHKAAILKRQTKRGN